MVSKIELKIDISNVCGLLALNLRKARDMINYNFFLKILHKIGIRGKFIFAYL